MSRLRELIDELCPDGVEYRPIKELYTKLRGTPITAATMKKIANDDGDTIIYAGGKTVVRANESDIPKANIIRIPSVVVQSRGVIDFIYCDESFTFKNEMWAYTCDDVVGVKFLYYILKSGVSRFRVLASAMSSLPQIAARDTEEYRIPVPPIEVQREIVRILDSFQGLDDALTAEIEAREKQLQSSIDMMLGLEDVTRIHGESVMLSSLCNSIFDGDHQPPPQASDGIPFIVIADFNKGEVDFSNTKYVGSDYYDGLKAVRKPIKGDVILSVTGSYGISALVRSDQPFCFQRHVALLKPKCNSVFLLALMRSGYAQRYFDMNVTGAIQKQISLTALRKMPVPVISEVQQEAIATKTWVMGSMISAIRSERDARRKQFAYYRDKLLAFPELNKEVDK